MAGSLRRFHSRPFGVAAAALQQMLPGEMRSQITAFYMVVLNVLGHSTGPTVTALLTQHVFRNEEAVNYSLLIVRVFASVPAVIVLRTGWKPFLGTLESLKSRPLTAVRIHAGKSTYKVRCQEPGAEIGKPSKSVNSYTQTMSTRGLSVFQLPMKA